MKSSFLTSLVLLFASAGAFLPKERPTRPVTQVAASSLLMDDFRLHNGEIVNPYWELKVDRSAEKKEIRERYLQMSRRYHPDAVRHKDALPDSCNNLEEVREQWERVRLAYEILSNRKTRIRYDRHEVLTEALEATGEALLVVGKGVFALGAKLMDEMNAAMAGPTARM